MELVPTLWIKKYQIKNESGKPIDFYDHAYLYDIYNDLSPFLVCMKAAQIGFSTLAILKTAWIATQKKLDIIYSLPTSDDVNKFVGGKTNRIIANNPILQQYTKDKDTITQKQFNKSMIYNMGTWTDRVALMTSADLYIADEKDRSKLEVVEQFASRLQHSDYKWQWEFSNPSYVGTGVDKTWQISDQMHWFVTCKHCSKRQYMDYPESFDLEKRIYVCKFCKGEITKEEIRRGQWIAKYKDRKWRGYWIPLWLYPKMSADDIITYHETKSLEYFYNFVCGKAYTDANSRITWDYIARNLTSVVNNQENVVIGCDSGIKKHYTLGNAQGLFYYGVTEDWNDIARFLQIFPKSVAVIDHLPDITGPRMLQEKFPGRVFLCHYAADKKTQQLIKWGEGDEYGTVQADRNRCIDILVGELIDRRIPIQGTEEDWKPFYKQLEGSYKVIEKDDMGNIIKISWEHPEGTDDHYLHALNYWRVGMDRFGASGGALVYVPKKTVDIPDSPYVDPISMTYSFNPLKR